MKKFRKVLAITVLLITVTLCGWLAGVLIRDAVADESKVTDKLVALYEFRGIFLDTALLYRYEEQGGMDIIDTSNMTIKVLVFEDCAQLIFDDLPSGPMVIPFCEENILINENNKK